MSTAPAAGAPGLADFDTDDGRLAFCHPVDDAELTEQFLLAGAVAAASSADARVRVNNTAGDYTAVGVSVAVAGPADPDAADGSAMILLSLDGDVFAAAVDLGDLAAGQISDPVTVRRVTAAGTAPARYAYTLTATAAGWEPAAAAIPAATATVGNTADGPDAYDPDAYDPDAAQPLLEDPEDQM